jgi:hypothetical protein
MDGRKFSSLCGRDWIGQAAEVQPARSRGGGLTSQR